MASHRYVLAIVLSFFSCAFSIPTLDPRAACNADNCLRQLRGGPSSVAASSYCSSFLGVPLASATASPYVVTVSTTFIAYSTLDVALHTNPNMKERDTVPTPTSTKKPEGLGARSPQATAPPSSTPLPAFASMCTSTGTTTSRLASACSCLAISTSTTTVTPTTTTYVGPTTTVAICPGTRAEILNVNDYSMRNNLGYGVELSVYDTSDPATCCGVCYTTQNCNAYEVAEGQCVLQYAYGPPTSDTSVCPLGLETTYGIVYGNPGYSGFGPCVSITT